MKNILKYSLILIVAIQLPAVVHGARITGSEQSSSTALQTFKTAVMFNNHVQVQQHLYQIPQDELGLALNLAVFNGYLEITQVLLQRKDDIDTDDIEAAHECAIAHNRMDLANILISQN